jgi:hypothetical protein
MFFGEPGQENFFNRATAPQIHFHRRSNRNSIGKAICDSMGQLVSSTHFLVIIRQGIQAIRVTKYCKTKMPASSQPLSSLTPAKKLG